MADRPRFGPAGVPLAFKELNRPVFEVPKYLRDEGLDAFEYQAVRWGTKPQMNKEIAEKLGVNAREHDVWLTVHGSYFLNFCGKPETIEASKNRLIACATAANWMGAQLVVFHPGYYMKRSPKEAMELCVKAISDVVESMKARGIVKVKPGPETAGRLSRLGSLDEVLTLCERVDSTEPVIDWAHIHARNGGKLKTVSDFQKIVDTIEKRLGTDSVRNLHCHFTHIEFTEKGEKRHHTLYEAEYGPDFQCLATVIAELGLKPVIISESPILDVDAQKMRNILFEKLEKRKSHK
jgi:deoxyribonuclease-4